MNVDALIRRAFMSLEDGDFDKANELLDQVLNEEPENALAYVGLLCAEFRVCSEQDLANCSAPIDQSVNFKRAVRFGDLALGERLNGYNSAIINRLNMEAKEKLFSDVVQQFETVKQMPESTQEQCLNKAEALAKIAEKTRSLGDYKDAVRIAEQCEKSINDLHLLEKQIAEKQSKEKLRKRKLFNICAVSFAAIVIGIVSIVIFSNYYKGLPDKYWTAYEEAYDNGNFDEAKKYYTKYINVIYKDKNERTSRVEEFNELCEKAKSTIDALQAAVAGDYAKYNELFDREAADIRLLPGSIAKSLMPDILNNLSSTQLEYSNNTFYWINDDGTVGRIGGNSQVDGWTDIKEIKILGENRNVVFGLQEDGTLINTIDDKFNMDHVTTFDVTTYGEYSDKIIVAAVNTEGRMMFRSTDNDISEQSGLNEALKYGDVLTVDFITSKKIGAHIDDRDRTSQIEFKPLNNAPILLVRKLDYRSKVPVPASPAYNYYIKYPTEMELILASLSGRGNAWATVAKVLQGYNLQVRQEEPAPQVTKESLLPILVDDPAVKEELDSRFMKQFTLNLYNSPVTFELILEEWKPANDGQ